jgi:hypothetical protein
MIIKNIEAKIRLATIVALCSLLTAIIISLVVSSYAYRQVSDARKSVYILNNNVPLMAS